MILFLGRGGRIGNQLFQIAFLESVRRPGERIISTGLGQALAVFPSLCGYTNSDAWGPVNVSDHVLRPLLLKRRALGGALGTIEDVLGEVVCRHGERRVRLVEGYFQFARLGEAAVRPQFRFSSGDSAAAQRFLERAQGRIPLFVHVRRGDYRTYAQHLQDSPLLPAGYYEAAVARLQRSHPGAHFFILGDDPDWCEHKFAHLPQMSVSRNREGVDLAIMNRCHGGVVSNSSFAWWGAHLCRRSAPVIAPTYWFRWRRREWYPQHIRSERFEYIDPNLYVGGSEGTDG